MSVRPYRSLQMCSTYEEIEIMLASIAEDLAVIRKNQDGPFAFIDKVMKDKLPHIPLVKLYKRPIFTERDC